VACGIAVQDRDVAVAPHDLAIRLRGFCEEFPSNRRIGHAVNYGMAASPVLGQRASLGVGLGAVIAQSAPASAMAGQRSSLCSHRRIIAHHARGQSRRRRRSAVFFMTMKPERSRCSTRRLAHDRGHHLSGVMRPLAPAVAQREGERIGEVVGAGGREAVGVGHEPRLSRQREQDKNGERPGVRLRKAAK
jgi:hypothetical protein